MTPGEGPTLYVLSNGRLHGYRTPVGRYATLFPKSESTPAAFDVYSSSPLECLHAEPRRQACFSAPDQSGLVTLLTTRARQANPSYCSGIRASTSSTGLAFMPDGKLISLSAYGGLICSHPGKVPVWTRPSRETRNAVGISSLLVEPHSTMALSPDGRWLATRDGTRLQIASAADGMVRCQLNIRQFAVSNLPMPMAIPTGRQLVVFASQRQFKIKRSTLLEPPSLVAVCDLEVFERLSVGAAILKDAMAQAWRLNQPRPAKSKSSRSIPAPSCR